MYDIFTQKYNETTLKDISASSAHFLQTVLLPSAVTRMQPLIGT